VRVTDRMIFNRASSSTAASRDRAQQATNELSSGQRVVHPGDDPVAAGLLVAHRQSEAREAAILSATARATDELDSADAALEGFGNLLSRARELTVQFTNSTYSADQRAVASEEILSLFGHALSLLNTQVDGRYIFGGNLDDSPPFDATGAYLGDTAIRQVEIAPGVLQDASVRADVIAKGAGGGADVLTALQSLATALATNSQAGIQAALDPLDLSIRQVANGRSRVGASMSVLDSAGLAARTARDAEREAASHEADADTIESASKLALAQRALDASLSASAKSFELTLLNKLR